MDGTSRGLASMNEQVASMDSEIRSQRAQTARESTRAHYTRRAQGYCAITFIERVIQNG